ncbi:SGNH/GDSL hydrolase family protein [Frigidibacter sp. RF13]|uniref:SGNH/GDSL hydrolase family protein n=1 Tax=Frigidibacter sp. RF13 TaxID=2997340 RepID=UPI002271E7CD|nr:SGNH/GDSL hydrolase family protein [Frigidibacter sp. RF13]MCY1126265.1 SGNH/GDSL hydrolase family protein [Frigidibacter sp. RF13]
MRTVICYGDSNTHGTMPMATLDDLGRLPKADRWPEVMAAALGAGFEVIAEGQPGRTTVHDDPVEGPHRNGLTVLPAVLESHRPVDLVILKLGTNDLKPRFSVSATDIALSLGKLVRVIRASGAGPAGGAPDVLVVAPPPVEEAGCLAEIFAGAAARSRALAGPVAREAARQGAGFFDAGTVIAVSPVDGVHYEQDTHRTLGLALAEAVRCRLGGD